MRKKLLRSRSGFEKPESREEAIMQNILGASNVLEPSESNIEEILKSILYNTPYTKEAEFEIEKILLAIKNNGTYDGEGESRDMKILIAILNDLDYTEEAESRIEELFIEWLHQRSSIKVLEGIPPLTFTSIGLPLINYLIEGNTAQSGTPTPDNPIMPEGTGERTRNLAGVMPFSAKWATVFPDLVTFLNQLVAGNYTLSYDVELTQRNNVSDNSTYGIAIIGAITQNTLRWDTAEVGTIRRVSHSFTINTSMAGNIERAYAYGCGINGVGATGEARFSNIMLNTGSTPLPYEPYGYKLDISSANTTTPVYLGEVETTRRIKKLVLTGEETWYKNDSVSRENTSYFYTTKITSTLDNYGGFCTHFSYDSGSYSHDYDGFSILSGYGSLRIRVSNNIATSTDGFRSYLATQYAAGTPVTVWYVLATEETAVVNEPLMKIGDYADTLSMEQAGESIPTANGSNTLDVDTTVKPSNIYIEYK